MPKEKKQISIILPKKPGQTEKTRVAAYCRVSTQAEEQNHSLLAQTSYYTQLLSEDENYELVGIYSDRGTSGTRTRNRENFLRLIADCRAGKIDAVMCKSVSRFGRNTVDTLTFTRELKALGIDVYFEKENLHTCSSEGELLLTLIAAVAESEAVSMSDNIKWGKRRQYEKGMVESLVLGTMLGFRQEKGEVSIVEEEAEIVRMIYRWFLEGHGYEAIKQKLIEKEVPTKRPGAKWANTTVLNILTNEKYCGDCLFQKTYISDPINHTSSLNRGEVPQYFAEDVLPAIIPKEEWLAAQELCKRHDRNLIQRKIHGKPFTGLIICPYCGEKYGTFNTYGTNRKRLTWYRCTSRKQQTGVDIPGMVYAPPSRKLISEPSPEMIAYREKYSQPKGPRQMLCTDIKLSVDRPETAFVQAWNLIIGKKERYRAALRCTAEEAENPLVRYRAREMIGLMDSVDRITEFDYPLMLRTLDYVEVHAEDRLTFVFQCGIRMTV